MDELIGWLVVKRAQAAKRAAGSDDGSETDEHARATDGTGTTTTGLAGRRRSTMQRSVIVSPVRRD